MAAAALLAGAPAAALVTLTLLLWRGEYRGSVRDRWLYKPVTSALFLVTAFAAGPRDDYDAWICAGLALGVVGDVCLIPRGRRWLLAGLSAFLLAHVAYVIAFASRAHASDVGAPAVVAVAAAGAALLRYLWPHLRAMRAPVLAYTLAISGMLLAATAVFQGGAAPAAFRTCVLAGALLFYLSDVSVARDRFVPGTGFANRAVGLPLYYVAQFLFAYSVAL